MRSARVALLERLARDPFDERTLGAGVLLSTLVVGACELPRQFELEAFVFTRRMLVPAKKVSKRQRAPFLEASALHDVDVMRVRPGGRAMKERAERIIGIRQVMVAKSLEGIAVGFQRSKGRHRDLDVDDWLGAQSGNGRGAVVIDSKRDSSERRPKAARFGFK